MRDSGIWDYIVVGAGSSGSVIASRLSQEPGVSVLLVEAGSWDLSPYLWVPAGEERAIASPKYSWSYHVEADPSRNNRAEVWPAGRVLGGSSSINGMIYLCGSAADYDAWAAQGNEGWAYQDVLPYFVRAETNTRGASRFHGGQGPLSVSDVRTPHQLVSTFTQAAMECGLPFNGDVNGASQFGVGALQATQKRGWRHSASKAYLWPARKRTNLTILTGALTRRVLIEKGQAVGIEYQKKGEVLSARARKEVILCAGALASPKLLMLSGIGPAQTLRQHGIPVVCDLPGVGQGLQEHPGVMISAEVNVRTYNVETDPWSVIKHGMNWLFRGRGPGATPIGHAVAFAKTRPDETEPDVQLTFTPIGYNTVGDGPLFFPMPAVVIAVNVCRPLARGQVTLRSADPADLPRIEHVMLGQEDDRRRLRDGAKMARQFFNTGAFAPYMQGELHPGAQVTEDEQWDAFLRSHCIRFSHPVGTCRMGPDGDENAVLDPQLRLRGVRGLRVADASIMPSLPSANTNAPAIMIGEKAADLIRQFPA